MVNTSFGLPVIDDDGWQRGDDEQAKDLKGLAAREGGRQQCEFFAQGEVCCL
jgi:hypothetical protein